MTADQITTPYLATHGHLACTLCGHEWRTVVAVIGLTRRCPGCHEHASVREVVGCVCDPSQPNPT